MSSRPLTAIALGLLLAGPACAAGAPLEGADPMRPPGAPAAGTSRAPSWTLSSTLVGDGRRLAVVNGRLVGVGDRVDGARVIDIDPRRVRLAVDGRAFDVPLQHGRWKQRTGAPR